MIALFGPAMLLATLCQEAPSQSAYTSCPPAVSRGILSDGYSGVSDSELLQYATKKSKPKMPPNCRCEGEILVSVLVKDDRVFCATALNGHPLLQKAAVEAAMLWRFKKNRGDFKNNITGTLKFRFKS
jgi:hypothetical protein